MSLRYLSLFSGIEAASVAWHPLGWECVGVAEIEKFPSAVLAHHYPTVPNLGDVTRITDAQIRALGRIDVVVGGSPCQDLSVAGKRAGLAGARSSLFHEQLRIFHAARHFCGARWLLWENVPGAFSSHRGRDFAVVVGAMSGADIDVPADGWGNEGVALGENGLVEWCVLDAQWFGVAQRRRRVFALLDSGDWTSRSPVLFEPGSLRGDSAPRRETRKGAAGNADTRLGRGGIGGGGDKPHVLEPVAYSIMPMNSGKDFKARETDVAHPIMTGGPTGGNQGGDYVVMAHGQGGAEIAQDGGAPTLTCNHEAPNLAFGWQNSSSQGASVSEHHAPTLDKSKTPAISIATQVRRLTPRECERLQGFPDDYTRIPLRNKDGRQNGKWSKDAPRYKALGNSFAVPVVSWIGRRIAVVESIRQIEAAA